ncbi:hypothetical protein E9993_02135 [Labilibacter sediminis]|nr:hypothetical protein E9993_02135 [Labilibacter sediminis]
MKNLILTILLSVIIQITSSQEKKSVEALQIDKPLTIDGYLNEEAYSHIAPAIDFVQLQPYNGKPSFQKTEVYFFYDQSAVYLGAMLYDNSPDSIFNFLSSRDNIGMSDYFGVYFDPYNKGQLAYGFFITPAGVQTDIKAIKSNYDREDGNWDAVWQSKTRVTDKGWIIEMRIPFSALRFPEVEVHTWGLNMFRNIRRYNSNNSWNFIDRQVSGFIHQQGELTGIKNIKPPIRLSLSPYVATYIESTGDGKPVEFLYKGGMDLKYGINESFTLDMMLIPDFGQIQSDDKQLNLSPFELYYDERRQFFTEGTELFQRGDIFYSRRIGAKPKFASRAEDNLKDNEVVDFNPTTTQLVNATKVSGRTTNGWGLGLLNAMSLSSNATIKDTLSGKTRSIEVQPFTNYNTFVVDKSLKNNSYVSLINTNMIIAGNPYTANVTATEFQIRDKNLTFAISGQGGYSHRKDENKQIQEGNYAELELEKNGGQLNFGVEQEYYSENYNPNDMGFLRRNNILTSEAYIEYSIVEPFFIFREWHIGAFSEYDRIVNPNDFMGSETSIWTYFQFKNNYGLNLNTGYGSYQHDYYETRVEGRYFYQPHYFWGNISLNTDRRKNLSFGGRIGSANRPKTDEYNYSGYIGIDVRLGQHLRLGYDLHFNNEFNNNGHVDHTENNDTIYIGKRDVSILENKIEIDYTFNNALSLSFRGRHYWSGVQYKDFFQLNEDGYLIHDPSYIQNHNNNLNIFNIDMILRWFFAPGSEISIAWKNAIFDEDEEVDHNLRSNFNNMMKAPKTNTISLKMLYYIDYHTLKNRRKK